MGNIDLDFIIFVVYFTCLAIVAVRAIRSLENQVTVTLNQADLAAQLEQLNLRDRLELRFVFRPFYGFEPLKTLTLRLSNTTATHLLYIDWDQCTIADSRQRSRRAIRLVPGFQLDASQPQTYTIVPPRQQVEEQMTTENSLDRQPDNSPNPLQNKEPVIDLAVAQSLSGGASTSFTVWLTIGFSPLERSVRPMQDMQTLRCAFTIQRALWIQRVPVAQFIRHLIPDRLDLPGTLRGDRSGWLLLITAGAMLITILLALRSS